MRPIFKLWMAAVAAGMATLILAALLLPRSFHLAALSDWIQCLLLLSGALSFLPNALRSRGQARLFWVLLGTGMAFWFSYQAMWIYFELWLRREVPDIFVGDFILFLHIVPMMAAMALRPHAPQDEYSSRLRRLDFTLLIFWWAFLYVFAVMAWQYVAVNVDAYGSNLNLLYLIEKIAFLLTLLVAWWSSQRAWKNFYANLFGASLTYAASSYVANWALSRHVYYSGSLYDIPLAVSMLWITWAGLGSRNCQPNLARSGSATHGVWLARLGMISVFSLPLFAVWTLSDPATPTRIRSFRLVFTLSAVLLMGLMVFVRQAFLDGELRRRLLQSRESLANLKRLQAQITESEKLASIGQLVGGAAHELNNPIAAMLGYSDLLISTPLGGDQLALASRIGQEVRRTRSLVASLLSFAKPGPSALASVNLVTLLCTAVRLSQPRWKSLKVAVDTDFQPNMPQIMGDSNQLLQICMQLLNSAMNAIDHQNSRRLTVTCEHKAGLALVHIFDSTRTTYSLASQLGTQSGEAPRVSTLDALSSLGLSPCQGILRQYQGNIFARLDERYGLAIRVELPVTPPRLEKSPAAALPAVWQPQPYA